MRLVEHHDRIVCEQGRVHRPRPPAIAAAREQQPRADHVDGADDHRGPCRVDPPRPVVAEPAAQHAELHVALGRKGRARVELPGHARERPDALDPHPDGLGRLIDDRAAVDDVDDAPRQGRVAQPRKEQHQYAQRLAETGRNVHRVGDRSVHERRVEPVLPRIGVVSGDCVEVRNLRDAAPEPVAHAALPFPLPRDRAVLANTVRGLAPEVAVERPGGAVHSIGRISRQAHRAYRRRWCYDGQEKRVGLAADWAVRPKRGPSRCAARPVPSPSGWRGRPIQKRPNGARPPRRTARCEFRTLGLAPSSAASSPSPPRPGNSDTPVAARRAIASRTPSPARRLHGQEMPSPPGRPATPGRNARSCGSTRGRTGPRLRADAPIAPLVSEPDMDAASQPSCSIAMSRTRTSSSRTGARSSAARRATSPVR